MSGVHVVEDNHVVRHLMVDVINRELASTQHLVRGYKFVWSLDLSTVSRRDIAVCDLFAAAYYVEPENANPRFHRKTESLPRKPENIKRATLDSIKTYFPPLHDAGLVIVVYSYVFKLLEDRGDDSGAEEVRRTLREHHVLPENILEKPAREVTMPDASGVAKRVHDLLDEVK